MKTFVAAIAALAAASFADASTTVAVIELGKGGTVRRTTTEKYLSSVSGVESFWGALHGRKLQHAGMTVVPDLFNSPESGLVVGLTGSGMDLANMPNVAALTKEEGSNNVVGHLEVKGSQGLNLLKRASSNVNDVTNLNGVKTSESGISAFNVAVNDENAANIDAQVVSLIDSLQKKAADADTTVVLHLVVEEEAGAARRRLLSRRLEDENQDEDQEDENANENADEDADGQQNDGSGYYAYGYRNAFGEWVTPYKTMFQIQYFNVVLWTSIGLTAVLFFSISLMMNMPLMADTLLFGESAKMMGE